MIDFIYDKTIRDSDNGIQLGVTVVETGSEDVQINLYSGRLRIPFFLTPTAAMQLAAALTNAVCAIDDDAVAKSSETTSN